MTTLLYIGAYLSFLVAFIALELLIASLIGRWLRGRA